MQKVAVVIPAYNEEESITNVVEGINSLKMDGYLFRPVVVNDCSLDSTPKIAKTLDCELIDLKYNIGIGGTVQTGFKYAFRNNFDFAVQVDGDGQHPPKELIKLIKKQKETNADIVIGSRFIDKAGFQSSSLRRFGINYFRNLIRLLCGITITDATSGMRLLNRKALELVNNYYPDEYPEPESVIYYHRNGLKISEVPVIMEERKGGESSIRAFKTLYYMIKVSLAIFYTFIRSKKSN